MKKTKQVNACSLHSIIKVLLIMKLTIVLLLISLVQVSASGLSQSISLKLNNTELKKALFTIEKKANCRFLYNDDAVSSVNTKVSINVENTPVTDVLNKMLAGTNLTYRLLDNRLIVLSTKENAVQDVRVKGKVTDINGAGVPGATIRVKGTNVATSADGDGNFSITAPDNGILVISSVGYNEIEVSVNGRTEIGVQLAVSTKVLDQVVVVGYGTQRKIDITGSVAQIRGDEIAKQSSSNPISALQGKVAGVQIVNNGQPGASPDIRIRGLGTYYGSASPLFIVDGVWVNDASFLSPQDIESISLLKDASSEAIYGIKGANGVVLITTNKGSRGNKPSVTYNGTIGYQKVTNQVKMANANEYATMFNELAVYSNSSNTLNPSQFGTGTNWFNQELRDALVTNHQIGVAGGSEKTTYNFSLSYLDQDGTLKQNNYQRYTATLQNDISITSKIKVGYTAIGYYSASNDAPGGIWNSLFAAPPVLPVKFADGTYGDPGYYGLGSSVTNPQVTMDYNNHLSRNYQLTANAYLDIKFLKHFAYHGSLGGVYADNQTKGYTPVYKATSTQSNSISVLEITRAETHNWLAENTITYSNTFANDHRLTILVGQHAEKNNYNYIDATAKNVPNINSGSWYLGLGTNQYVNDVDATNPTNPAYPLLSTVSSYFGRINYAYKDKYLLNATLRGDGSSKFNGSARTGYFPSAGVAWIITKEDFMQNQKIFNSLKLKGSWGQVGNIAVPTYIATQSSVSGGNYNVIFGNSGTISPGVSVASLAPDQIKWERSEGTDIGLEGAVLANRLNFEIDYYNRLTKDMILQVNVPSSAGGTASYLLENAGTLQNTGVELALNWKDAPTKDFNYSIAGNVSFNANKVKSITTGNVYLYDGGKGATGGQFTTRTTVGQPIGEFFGYKAIGIFQSYTDIQSYKDVNGTIYQPNAQPGDFKYAKTSNKGIGAIGSADRINLGNPNPKINFGLNMYFEYKQFDLALDFQGVAGVSVYNALKGLRYGAENWSQDFYNHRWHGEGTSNIYPSVNVGGGANYDPNSWYVENGSYVRIRNIQLGYNLSHLKANWIQKLRVYANIQNPFNFFKYKGFTPELAGGAAGNIGIDTQVYPLSATYNLGVNVTF